MDRQLIYPGQIPLETDLLQTNKNVMLGHAFLAQDLLGTSTTAAGFTCVPNSPAALNVIVTPGRLYQLVNVDATAYSSIASDTTHQILKQGILLDPVILSCPAPATAGQSINYLIEAIYVDADTTNVVLPYYNAGNPPAAWSGPGNSGASQPTKRQGLVSLVVKAGVPATTGTQTTPAPDTNYVGLFVVTVANGQSTITAGSISTYSGAPFLQQTDFGLRADLANTTTAGKGNELISWRRIQAEINASITPANYFIQPYTMTRYTGVVADGSTDCTAAILAVINAMGGQFIIPYNVRYTRNTLYAGITKRCVLIDQSQINGDYAAGQTSKLTGVVSFDTAPSDTHFAIMSDHHSIMQFNNFHTAGSASALAGLQSIVYCMGEYSLGSVDKRGFRSAAILQWGKSVVGNFWQWGMRSLAPWVSAINNYEAWAAGQVISGAGVYRSSSVGQYVSTGAGTTGATEPTHTSGTVSDGGVSWTYVDSIDRSLFSIDEVGRWLTGSGGGTNTFEHKVSSVNPSGNYTMRLVANGVSKTVDLALVPTNAGNVETAVPFMRADSVVGLRGMKSDASTDITRLSDANGFQHKQYGSISVQNSTTGATPSVAGIGTLIISNGGAQNITALTGGVDDQIVRLVFSNANTTMVSSATLLMTGSVNVTPTSWSYIEMYKVPAGISDRWIEISRSIK